MKHEKLAYISVGILVGYMSRAAVNFGIKLMYAGIGAFVYGLVVYLIRSHIL